MNIDIIGVGNIKETYWKEAIGEYSRRLSRYCTLRITEVKDEKAPEGLSDAEERKIKETEGKRILGKIREDSFVVALEIRGGKYSSESLAENFEAWSVRGKSHLVFVIGGSLGLSAEVLSRADELLSFSDMTFPHQMMRVILLEQIYRSYRILRHEPYHK